MEKMATLGNLVRGLAREVTTPLGAIMCNNDSIGAVLRKIKERLDMTSQQIDGQFIADMQDLVAVAEDSLRTSHMASDRLRTFLRNLRNFSRIGTEALERVDIREPIETALTLLAH